MRRVSWLVSVRSGRAVVLGFSLLLLAASSAFATVRIVDPDGSGEYPHIQAAIDAAVDGDVIELMDGIFEGPGNGALDLQAKELSFRSHSGHAEHCIVSLNGLPFIENWGMYSHGTSVLGLMLLHASGVYLYGIGIEFTSCIFLECSGVAYGGYCGITFHSCLFLGATGSQAGVGENGSLTLDHCAVRGATAVPFSTNHIRAVACRFEDNAADHVIAVHFSFFPGSAQLEMCEFYDNPCGVSVIDVGDGQDATLSARLCTFARNEGTTILFDVTNGYHAEQSVSLTSCTFADNRGDGPEIMMISPNQSAFLDLDQTVLSFREGGSAVACDGVIEAQASCTDIYGNEGGDWTSCLSGLEGTGGNLSADPLFCRMPGQPPYVLREDSPCLPQGGCDLIGAWRQGCQVADVAEGLSDGPRLSIRPNPFRSSTEIVLARAPLTDARITIFDPSGREVREIDWPAGRASLSWDGADQRGRPLPAGMYLYRVQGKTGRLLLLR